MTMKTTHPFDSPGVQDYFKFDLHGCVIFDTYSPISCPPSKGLIGPLKFLDREDIIFSRVVSTDSALYETPFWGSLTNRLDGLHFQSLPEHDNFTTGETLPPIQLITIRVSSALLSQLRQGHEGLTQPPFSDNPDPRGSDEEASDTEPLASIADTTQSESTDGVAGLQAEQFTHGREEWVRRIYGKQNTPMDGLNAISTNAENSNPTLNMRSTDTPEGPEPRHQNNGIWSTFLKKAGWRPKTSSISTASDARIETPCQPQVASTASNDVSCTGEKTLSTYATPASPRNMSQPSSDSHASPSGVENEHVIEVAHIADFFSKALSTSNKPIADTVELEKWLSSLMHLLQALQDEAQSAAIILSLLVDDRDLENTFAVPPGNYNEERVFFSTIQLASFLPASFVRTLYMPVVATFWSTKSYAEAFAQRKAKNPRAVITPIPLVPGDHIYREIREKGALKHITHHGIYTGGGRIIHFAGNELSLKGLLFPSQTEGSRAAIRVTSILRFMVNASQLRVRRYKNPDSSETVIFRAEQALMDQTYPEYNLFKNNCEHFCHYCKTGRFRSKQVTRGIQAAAIAGAAVATASAGALILSAALSRSTCGLDKKRR